MTTIPHPCLEVQASEQSQPSVPPWFAETVLLVEYLRTHGLLDALTHQVHLVRGRFGQYEVLDLSRSPLWLRHQRGAYLASVFRASEAVCGPVHGAL
jgi:hypothetical protein